MPPGSDAEGRRGHRPLERLRRRRRDPLLPAAGPAVAEQLLWPTGDRHQGLGGPRGASPRACAIACARTTSASAPTCSRWRWGRRLGRPIQYRVRRTADRQGPRVRHGPGRRARRQPEHSAISSTTGTSPGRCSRSTSPRTRRASSGCPPRTVAQIMNSVVTGSAVTQVRDDIYLVNIIGRAEDSERGSLETWRACRSSRPAAPRSRSRRSPRSATSWSSRWCGAATASRRSR